MRRPGGRISSGVRTRAGDFAIDELAAVMSDGVIVSDAVEEYSRLCPGAPVIAFCVDIAHSEMVAAAFTAGGYRAAHVDGTTPKEERRRLIAALGTGEIQVLSNCGLISEGLDVPNATAAILLRPTRSLTLYLQQVGRALRPAQGKTRACILDHSGNAFRFGLADMAREWRLAGRAKIAGEAPVKRCLECGALIALGARTCPECNTVLVQLPAPILHRERAAAGHLVELGRLAVISYRQALRWAGADEHRLRLVAQVRGYKAGWVWHRLQELRGGSA